MHTSMPKLGVLKTLVACKISKRKFKQQYKVFVTVLFIFQPFKNSLL